MTLYQIVLTPASPAASPLQSDTLFGAFCWSWLRRHGREALEAELIVPSLHGGPPVIFSNAFPHGTLPLPLGCYDPDNNYEKVADKGERRAAYRRGKKLKSARFVTADAFARIRRGDWRGFTASLCPEAGEGATTLHNMVSRESGTVESSDEGGSLFALDRHFYQAGQKLDCYLLTSLEVEPLRAALDSMFALGIGADKSVGCGAFRVESFSPCPELLEPPDGANAFIALSNFLPARSDPAEGWYQTLPKYPMLDRELAASEHPFKKPLLFLKGGSVFRTESPRAWYGRCVTGVAAVEEPVTVNGCTIAVPARIPEDG